MHISSAFTAWAALLGPERVDHSAAAQQSHGADTTGTPRAIVGALRPAERGQIPGILRIATEHGIPLYPISTGRNWGYGTSQPATDGCVVLDLSGMDRILAFDSDTGAITLEPGVTQGQLAAFLHERKADFLVPVSGAGPSASLLGNALERGYGVTPHADHFAAVTALEVFLPDGRLYRGALDGLGGADINRLFKWGIGPYLDGIFTQSALGITVAGTILLARRPEAVEAFLFRAGDDQLGSAVAGVRDIMRRLPGVIGGVNLMNRHRVLAMTIPYPYEQAEPGMTLPPVLVRAQADRLGIAAWSGFGTLYGTAGMVRTARKEIRACLRGRTRRPFFFSSSRARRLARIAQAVPDWMTGGLRRQIQVLATALELVNGHPNETALRLCYWRGGSTPPAGMALDPARDGCGLRWYAPLVPMTPDIVQQYVAQVTRIAVEHGVEPLITLTSVSDACFDSTVPILFDLGDAEARRRAAECHVALRDQGCARGWVPYRVGVGEQRWLCDRPDPFWDTVDRIKRAIDPAGIIAPGRYAPRRDPLPARSHEEEVPIHV